MWVSEITEDKLQNEMIDRILFEELDDNGECVDCIIVLGSIKASKYRVPVAVNAYMFVCSRRLPKTRNCNSTL